MTTLRTRPGILVDRELREALGTSIRPVPGASPISPAQVQPASLDLRLGPVAYRIRAGFLPDPGPGRSMAERLEVRMGDGAANPYLMFAAMLACGLDGIDNATDPGEPNTANLYTLPADEVARRGIATLPRTLVHAADALDADDVLGEGLGMTPDGPYRDYFAEVKRAEFFAHHHEVTPGEVQRYLTLF